MSRCVPLHVGHLQGLPAANMAVNLPTDCYFEIKKKDDLAARLINKLSTKTVNREYDLSAYNWDVIAQKTAKVYSDIL